jgi:signal transduction histidine kinase
MLVLVEDLARRAGMAIDNARLVRELEQAHERVQEQAAELEIQAEELQTQNEELESSSQQLVAALRTRTEFMATVSHELRTPLNAIMGYTQLIEMGVSGEVPEPVLGHVRRIGLSARHLLQLIDDILTFSALESKRDRVVAETVALAELLDDVRGIIQPIASRAGLELGIRAADAPDSLVTDPRKLRQILLNLLGNAVKFTSQGSITLDVSMDGSSVIFEVADSGMGIPPEEQSRLFEPYWQSTEARSKQIGGAGLGLSISQRLAQLMGGSLSASSTPGRGSVFTLRLPIELERP